MKALITGGTGFVGRAVARRWLAEGRDVHVLVRDAGRAADLEALGARLFAGTIADPNDVVAAARGCEVVVHCAALTDRTASLEALGWANVAGTENVLNAAKHVGCRRLIHLSCADVTLQRGRRLNWHEDRAPARDPADPYARTKLRAEELVIGGGDARFETVALRPAWIWGPGDTSVLPGLAREGLASGIWIVGDGQYFVPTTYIEHLVDAIGLASSAARAAGGVYHVLDGELVLAIDFFGGLAKALGLAGVRSLGSFSIAYAKAWLGARLGWEGPSPAELERRGLSATLDQQRAIEELGYRPELTNEAGMAALERWVREQGGIEAIAALRRA